MKEQLKCEIKGYEDTYFEIGQVWDTRDSNIKATIIEIGSLLDTLISPAIKNIGEGFKLINFENIGTNFKRAMENLAEIGKIGLENLYPIFQAKGEMFGTYLKYGIAIVGNYFDPIVEGFANFTENFKPNMISWIEETSSTIINDFKNLEYVFDIIGNRWLESIEKYKPMIIEATEDTFTNISKTIGLVITVIADTSEIISGKIKEFKRILQLASQDIELVTDLAIPDVAETGATFEENALLKAFTIAKFAGVS